MGVRLGCGSALSNLAMWNDDGGDYSIFCCCPTTETKYMTNKMERWRLLRNRTRQPIQLVVEQQLLRQSEVQVQKQMVFIQSAGDDEAWIEN